MAQDGPALTSLSGCQGDVDSVLLETFLSQTTNPLNREVTFLTCENHLYFFFFTEKLLTQPGGKGLKC